MLDNLQDPGNLGTLLRTADAVGVSGVVMTDNCVDLYNPKVVRSAMGSTTRLDLFVVDNFLNVATLLMSLVSLQMLQLSETVKISQNLILTDRVLL